MKTFDISLDLYRKVVFMKSLQWIMIVVHTVNFSKGNMRDLWSTMKILLQCQIQGIIRNDTRNLSTFQNFQPQNLAIFTKKNATTLGVPGKRLKYGHLQTGLVLQFMYNSIGVGLYKQTNKSMEVDVVAPQRAFRPLRSHGTHRQHMGFAKSKPSRLRRRHVVGGGVVVG